MPQIVGLTETADATVKELFGRLAHHGHRNSTLDAYYRGAYRTSCLGVGTPPLPQLATYVMGWAATVVDVLEERLGFLGWTDEAGEAIDELAHVYRSSCVASESSSVHIDSLIYGIGFVSVTAGGPGESPVLISAHSPTTTTGVLDPRTGLLKSGLTIHDGQNATVWLPDVILELGRTSDLGPWRVTETITHGLGAVPLVPVVNRTRAGDKRGSSEITPAIRTYIDSATRAMVAMDVNRELFSVPQRYAIGLGADQFVGADGNPMTSFDLAATKMLIAPRDEEGDEPKFGEFSTVSPGPYLEQIEGLAKLVASAAGMPVGYMSVNNQNPASADAIRQLESRLVRRAERRQSQFTPAWAQVGRLALAILENQPIAAVETPYPLWSDPATYAPAAAADAYTKLAAADIIPTHSDVILAKLGFSEVERARIRDERDEVRSADRLATITERLHKTVSEGWSDERGVAGNG